MTITIVHIVVHHRVWCMADRHQDVAIVIGRL